MRAERRESVIVADATRQLVMQEAANDVIDYVQSITNHLSAGVPAIKQVVVEAPDLVNLQPLEGCMPSRNHHTRPMPTHSIHRDLIPIDYEVGTCDTVEDLVEAMGTARPVDLGWTYPQGAAF